MRRKRFTCTAVAALLTLMSAGGRGDAVPDATAPDVVKVSIDEVLSTSPDGSLVTARGTLLNRTTSGVTLFPYSARPYLSSDASSLFVVTSEALVPGDTDNDGDVYRMSLSLGTPTLLTTAAAGAAGDLVGYSGNGSLLAIVTSECNAYVFACPVGARPTIVYDTASQQPLNLFSTIPAAQRRSSGLADISTSGRLVAFVAGSPSCSSCTGLWLLDRSAGTSSLISVLDDGTPLPGQTVQVEISGDGSHVAFIQATAQTDAPGGFLLQLYVRSVADNETWWIDDNLMPSLPIPLSLDETGNRLVYRDGGVGGDGELWMLDFGTGAADLITAQQGTHFSSPGLGLADAAVSADGKQVFWTAQRDSYTGTQWGSARALLHASLPSATRRAAYTPLTPRRVLDSRVSGQTIDGKYTAFGPLLAGQTQVFEVFGRPGMLSTARAVVLNVTATGATTSGYLSVWPCGLSYGPPPNVSNLNVQPYQDRANTVVVPISPRMSRVCVATSMRADVVIDLNGFFPARAELAASFPFRQMDTRPGGLTWDGSYAGTGRLMPGAVVRMRVPDALQGESVIVNLTSTGALSPGYATAWPCDTPTPPNTSNLNFIAGVDVANEAVVPVNAAGEICLAASAPTHLIVDVNGYLWADSGFAPISPKRLLDTRPGARTVDGSFQGLGRPTANTRSELQVSGRAGVPSDARAAVLNVTATGTTGAGYITVWPCDTQTPPNSSNLNYSIGADVPALAIVPLSPTGTVCLQASVAGAHLIADISGWFEVL